MPLYLLTSIFMNFWNIEHYGASFGDYSDEKKTTNSLFKEYHYVLIINYEYSSEVTLVTPTNSGQ